MTGFEKIYNYNKWRTRKILKNDSFEINLNVKNKLTISR